MSLVHDLFPPLFVSTAQSDTGHSQVANMKKQRCIPFGLSLTIVCFTCRSEGEESCFFFFFYSLLFSLEPHSY